MNITTFESILPSVLFLTSAGLSNKTLVRSFENLIGFKGEEVKIAFIPTVDLREPIYALDDNSAVIVNNDKIEVVSEGKWRKFN